MRALLALTLAACGGAAAPCPTAPAAPTAPTALDPGALVPVLVVHARGTQTYACQGGAWTLVHPKAYLYDDTGREIGVHGDGPSWELLDGSRVAGTKLAAATVDATAIPWLLVGASGGSGRFAQVTRVQRVHTTGGVAPASCAASDASLLDVPYTADYYFYAPAREPRCGPGK